MSVSRAAMSLYVALAVHALLLLGLALRPLPQNSAGQGIGLSLPGSGLDEIDRALASAPFAEALAAQTQDATLAIGEPVSRATRIETARANSAAPDERRRTARIGGGGRDGYYARLRRHLAGFRRELPFGLPSAQALVRFRVDSSGQLEALELLESSGVPALDAEAIELFRRAAPLPAAPDGRARSLVVPVMIESGNVVLR